MKEFRFRPAERLKSRQLIQDLFKDGKSFGMYPLRLVYLPLQEVAENAPIQCTVSVSKRSFKRAVHRNRIRRQVRESWRQHKNELYGKLKSDPSGFAFMILYVAKEPLPYSEIDKAMQKMIRRFVKIQLAG